MAKRMRKMHFPCEREILNSFPLAHTCVSGSVRNCARDFSSPLSPVVRQISVVLRLRPASASLEPKPRTSSSCAFAYEDCTYWSSASFCVNTVRVYLESSDGVWLGIITEACTSDRACFLFGIQWCRDTISYSYWTFDRENGALGDGIK